MQKITTFLWYDGQAEEAAKLYTSLIQELENPFSQPLPGRNTREAGIR